MLVSIHAPHAGRDETPSIAQPPTEVSIHAPHAGRDFTLLSLQRGDGSFNPRAPCGARPVVMRLSGFPS